MALFGPHFLCSGTFGSQSIASGRHTERGCVWSPGPGYHQRL